MLAKNLLFLYSFSYFLSFSVIFSHSSCPFSCTVPPVFPVCDTSPWFRGLCRLFSSLLSMSSSSPLSTSVLLESTGWLHLSLRITYCTIVPFSSSLPVSPLRCTEDTFLSVYVTYVLVYVSLSVSPFCIAVWRLLPFSAHLYFPPLISLPVSYMNECALAFVQRFIQLICLPCIPSSIR